VPHTGVAACQWRASRSARPWKLSSSRRALLPKNSGSSSKQIVHSWHVDAVTRATRTQGCAVRAAVQRVSSSGERDLVTAKKRPRAEISEALRAWESVLSLSGV
jgi:hypothetical protein